MVDRVAVGSRWRRRRDGTVWKVHQSHRKDRLAELVRDETLPLALASDRTFVSFDDLRERYREVR